MRKIQSNYFLLRNLGERVFACTPTYTCKAISGPFGIWGRESLLVHLPTRAKLFSPSEFGGESLCLYTYLHVQSYFRALRNLGERVFACTPTYTCKAISGPFGIWGRESLLVHLPTRAKLFSPSEFGGESLCLYTYLHVQSYFRALRNLWERVFACTPTYTCKAISGPFGIWGRESLLVHLPTRAKLFSPSEFGGESLCLYTYLHVQSYFPLRNLGERVFACTPTYTCKAIFPFGIWGRESLLVHLPTRAKLFSPSEFGSLSLVNIRVQRGGFPLFSPSELWGQSLCL